ncbi:phosphotransferase family protein [Rhodococcoides kyotonense]|uniref:Predicted kinase, aminoglycoside phosphotransferase (APT) family n=1 Tax=Rhodococcoides kyotonense TaxID=398843 RepID=A0A239HY62_9NOCA|nr:phosphotransferase family protein [Rhodococcus kyotonensis]SNS85134.1 Predicted kinase, aminoglycoside phosphotransferase (APT) family [Rhodococcus kyotonensis]
MPSAGVDESAVSEWIGSLGIGAVSPLNFQRIGNGQSNLTFAVSDASGSRWVLRRPPLGTLLASAHDVVREYRILSALQNTAVPVPKMLALSENPAVSDVPLVLMSHVDGVVIDSVAVANTTDTDVRRAVGLGMADALAEIHRVDLESVGLLDLASHKPYAQRQLKRWTTQWEHTKTRDVSAIDSLARRLAANAPEQHELSLVHGDFHLNNVITSRTDGSIVAVVDWELCTLGDPLADLGGLLAYWPEAGDDVAGPFMASTLPGFPTRAELVAEYARSTGRDVSAADYWQVLALWKLAIIAEGVMRRAEADARNRAAAGAPTTTLVDDILARATSIADDIGL